MKLCHYFVHHATHALLALSFVLVVVMSSCVWLSCVLRAELSCLSVVQVRWGKHKKREEKEKVAIKRQHHVKIHKKHEEHEQKMKHDWMMED